MLDSKENVRVGAASTYVTEIKRIMQASAPNAEFLFRGQSSVDYQLLPSLGRSSNFLKHERDLIALAKYKKPDVFTNTMLPLETLALLQHYGVPTRLLDVTESALVALYFACQPTHNANNKDGVVYVFCDKSKRVSNHAILNAVADSAYILNFNNLHTVRLEDFFDAMLKQSYWKSTSAAQGDHKNSKPDYVDKHLRGPLFVNAPAFTLRQQIQQGRYILFPNKITHDANDEKCFSDTLAPIDENDESVAGKIIISNQQKKSVLKELKTLGITEYSLFSDSIDIVCKGIKDQFLND